MQIRKLYRFEACHIVRNCNSERCKKSFHGHSYVVELFFTSNKLTNYGMVLDFGDLKKLGIAKFIDSLDHAWHFWDQEEAEVQDFIKNHNQRWVKLKVNPTAENYAILLLYHVNRLMGGLNMLDPDCGFNDKCDNSEVYCNRVIVHETATGYAEAGIEDLAKLTNHGLQNITFSPAVQSELDKDMENK